MEWQEKKASSRPRARRIVLWILAALFGFSILAMLLVHQFAYLFFLPGGCQDKIVDQIPSPNGKLKAVLYIKDCGATTRPTTIIIVLPISQDRPGYRQERIFAGYEPASHMAYKVRAQWASDEALTVYYTKGVELIHLDNHVGKVWAYFKLVE